VIDFRPDGAHVPESDITCFATSDIFLVAEEAWDWGN